MSTKGLLSRVRGLKHGSLCGGGSSVLPNVRGGQPSDPATTMSSDCGAEWGDVVGGVPCPGRCFATLPRKVRYFGRGRDWIVDLDDLERYGRKREIVVGVVLFHKLIETECHINWDVQDLALFAKVLAA